jgi:hypothetical protein
MKGPELILYFASTKKKHALEKKTSVLRGQCNEIVSTLGFFSLKHPSWAPDYGAKAFSNINSNREDIRIFKNAWGVIDTCMVHAVALTPHAQ